MISSGSAATSSGLQLLPERLKYETAAAHERIEQVVDLEHISSCIEAYRDLLARFYGFHAAWEPLAKPRAPLVADFDRRRKTPLLITDLHALGLSDQSIRKLPLCDPLMPTRSRWEVYGTMYVLEGATLGGAIIARAVGRRLGLDATNGCSFFRCYGPETGAMWKAFRSELCAVSRPGVDQAVIASANRTFECLTGWLRCSWQEGFAGDDAKV